MADSQYICAEPLHEFKIYRTGLKIKSDLANIVRFFAFVYKIR